MTRFFESGFEDDYSSWTTRNEGGGATTAIDTNFPYTGAKCSLSTAPAGTGTNAQKNLLIQVPIAYIRCYVRFGTLPTAGTSQGLMSINVNGDGNFDLGSLVQFQGADLYWGLTITENGVQEFDLEAAPSNPIAGVYYCVEMLRDATNDIERLWINGQLKVDKAVAITNTNVNQVYAGVGFSDTACSVYCDNFVVADDYIGPEGAWLGLTGFIKWG